MITRSSNSKLNISHLHMSAEESISNPFARVLQFYYLYQRNKLVASDLEKIARKYGNKQDKLLTDLQQKYPFDIPSSVSKHQLSMLCSMHSIPPSYANCMKVRDISYDSRCDVYQANFDPLHCLLWNDISVSHINAPTLDNISKTLCILPNCEVPVVASVRKYADFPSNSCLSTMVEEKSRADAAPKTKHLFETIAEVAVRGKIPRNSHNHEVQTASPLALLQQCMQQRVRVRIIIRRNHR